MFIINNEVKSFEAKPGPMAPLKTIFSVCSHRIMDRYSNWKQAISDGESFRKWKPLIQFCLGRVSFYHHMQLGLLQGLAKRKREHISGRGGKAGLKDKISEVWECWAPVPQSPCALPVLQGPLLCQGLCKPHVGGLVVVLKLHFLSRD